jgi:hypothetical protein
LSFTSALHCDIPGCLSREFAADDSIPKGWTRIRFSDRVVTGIDLDICEEHTPTNNKLLTIKEIASAAHIKAEQEKRG